MQYNYYKARKELLDMFLCGFLSEREYEYHLLILQCESINN